MNPPSTLSLLAIVAVGAAVLGLLHWLGHLSNEKQPRRAGWRSALWALIGCFALIASFGVEQLLTNGMPDVLDSINSRPCQYTAPGCPGYDYDSTSSP
jgi:hypothetical protein